MSLDHRLTMLRDAQSKYLAGRMSRRQVIGLLGALGLSLSAAPWLTRKVGAESAAGHGGHGPTLSQEGSPPAEGAPPATPELGPQADGTTTWKVVVGGFNEALAAEYSQFLPETITINAGDRIYFEMGGFHNVVFGDVTPKPLILPDPSGATPIAASGQPDQPQLIFNPEVLFPAGGDVVDGSTFVNSGVALDPTAPPVVFTFPTAGTFDMICLIHAMHMKGQVVVQEAGSELPMDQAAIDEAVAARLAELDAEAEALLQTAPATPAAGDGATTHEVLVGPGQQFIDTFKFVPSELSINAGDTVRWVWASSMTPHTVTFLGGEDPVEDIIISGGEAGPPTVYINPLSIYGTENPGTYSGEGLVNSGYLFEVPALPSGYTLPTSFELIFDTAGEYGYYCILHAGSPDDDPSMGMTGKIIVAAAG